MLFSKQKNDFFKKKRIEKSIKSKIFVEKFYFYKNNTTRTLQNNKFYDKSFYIISCQLLIQGFKDRVLTSGNLCFSNLINFAMSQEILPKSKNNLFKSAFLQKNFSEMSINQPKLTKVLNPLVNTTKNKYQLQTSENDSTKHSGFQSRQFSNATITENEYYHNAKAYNEPKLKNPQYNFYMADLNQSSDVSFTKSSFQECREQLEQKISQNFNNSKSQIQNLIQQSPTKNRIRLDKKQLKRQKLRFYHCDQIVIRPCLSNKPVKVFDLAIYPTKKKYDQPQNQQCQTKNDHEQVEKSRDLNQVNRSTKRIAYKKLLELINESPLNNSKNYENHQFVMDSPSFLEQRQKNRNGSKSAKQIIWIVQNKENDCYLGHKMLRKEHNLEKQSKSLDKSNTLKSQSEGQHLERRVEKTSQNIEEMNGRLKFKRRNMIFRNDKKYGLKLSRAIRKQAQIQMLKEEIGIDVFHIIIEEQELLKNCCS